MATTCTVPNMNQGHKVVILEKEQVHKLSSNEPGTWILSVRPEPVSLSIISEDVAKQMQGKFGKIGDGDKIVTFSYRNCNFGPIYVRSDEEVRAIVHFTQYKIKEREYKDKHDDRRYSKGVYMSTDAARARSLLAPDIVHYLNRAFTSRGMKENIVGRKQRNYPKRSAIIKTDPVTGVLINPPGYQPVNEKEMTEPVHMMTAEASPSSIDLQDAYSPPIPIDVNCFIDEVINNTNMSMQVASQNGRRKLTSCHEMTNTCHEMTTRRRSLKELLTKCKFTHNGCLVLNILKELEVHEIDCVYRNITCPFHNCKAKNVSFIGLDKHIVARHKDLRKIGKSKSKDIIPLSIPKPAKWIPQELTFRNRSFFTEGVYGSQYFGFWIYFHGTPEEAGHYSYGLKITGGNGNELTYKSKVTSLDQTDMTAMDLFFLSEVQEKLLQVDGLIHFEITLYSDMEEIKNEDVETGISADDDDDDK
jgi:hypothetical protein